VHAFRGEMLARGLHVLCRDLQARPLPHRLAVVVAFFHRDHHAAPRDPEIDRLIQTVAAVLIQHVLAGDPEVGRAVLHVRRHVGCAHDDHAHVAAVRREDELARSLGVFARRDPGGREQRHRLVENAAFGQRDRDHG
jgi:hypothetical protein